ncbi:MAG: HigA family addiction module antitoxin [Acholeplasmataceae bacterium]|jgi:HTH-type transcriptional regulator/antitoxin HigA
MGVKQQHISLDELLIHPGDTLLEAIQDRNITQKELAIRTGYTEKHISTVISGQKSISAEFAKSLEYALNISASFWRNLQTNYDLEVVDFNEKHNITEQERKIAREIKPTIELLIGKSLKADKGLESVYTIRKLLGVSNLNSIINLNPAQYRAQFTKNTSDYVIYTWQYLIEEKVQNQTNNILDVRKLKDNLNQIKEIMHQDSVQHISLIRKILNDCGILFTVEKHGKNTPINGLTTRTKTNQVMIALTIRGKFVDVFWFTLFHEIAHVINGDYLKKPEVWEKDSLIENRANKFASDTLIDPKKYLRFVKTGNFNDYAIEIFARENGVLKTIVYGRLMHDKIIPWNNNLREIYEWID